MRPVEIAGATHVLGAPLDWDPLKQGDCVGLPVRLLNDPDVGPEWKSAWRPSPAELVALMNGGVVLLTVCGDGHPPVMIEVSKP
jgi:hypothetical protein